MKKIKFLVVFLFVSVMVNAQEVIHTQVPSTFTEGLLQAYPDAKDIEWERSNNDYKVTFKSGLLERKIYFNRNGDQVKIEAEMSKTTLPTKLANAIRKDYAGYKIDSVHSIYKNGITTYEVVLVKEGWVQEVELTYSEAGNLLDSKS